MVSYINSATPFFALDRHIIHQFSNAVIPGVIYTLGVLLRYGQETLVDRRTGYSLITDAVELLIAATQAFKTESHDRTVCTFSVIESTPLSDKNLAIGQSYPVVFVKEDNAIVTFYPDATPENRSCQLPKKEQKKLD